MHFWYNIYKPNLFISHLFCIQRMILHKTTVNMESVRVSARSKHQSEPPFVDVTMVQRGPTFIMTVKNGWDVVFKG